MTQAAIIGRRAVWLWCQCHGAGGAAAYGQANAGLTAVETATQTVQMMHFCLLNPNILPITWLFIHFCTPTCGTDGAAAEQICCSMPELSIT